METDKVDTQLQDLRKAMDARDDQARNLVRRLHDGLSQQMTALLVGLKVADLAKSWEDTRNTLSGLREICLAVLNDVRLVMHELQPGLLAHFGLFTALEDFITRTNRNSRFQVSLVAEDLRGLRLPVGMECGLYEIIAKSLVRLTQVQGVTRATVTVCRLATSLELRIAHDGSDQPLQPPFGEGLVELAWRIAHLDGTIQLTRRTEGDTEVTISTPLPEVQNGEDPRPNR